MKIFAKKALLDDHWQENVVVTVAGNRIISVETGTEGDVVCDVLTPGLFDVHTHGGVGYYYPVDDAQEQQKYLDEMLRHGVTDILFSTATHAEYDTALKLCRNAMVRQQRGEASGACIRGVHLEGPFLNPGKCGAMEPAWMPAATVENFEKLFGAHEDIIRLVTVAPEVPDGEQLVKTLVKKGFKVQIGHTCATYEEANAAFEWGVDSVCHTFNAAPSIHHRAPGCVTAALLQDQVYCEVICDFVHLHPGAVKLIYKTKGPEKMMVISDSVGPTGLSEGRYPMAGKIYDVRADGCYLEGTNTLSGSRYFSDQGVRNLISVGVPSQHAFRMASRTPAERMGLDGLGRIVPGGEAHLAAWDENWQCVLTVIGDQVMEHGRRNVG